MKPSAPPAISIQRVSKSFASYAAVDNLFLNVPAGCIYGLVGPNGSGKTTVLRMVMNLILPDRGSIEVLGANGSSAARDRVSYLPEERGLYRKMTVGDVLNYFGRLKGTPSELLKTAIPRWLKKLDLLAWKEKKVETLSKGMSQKIQFIAALISEPMLLVLDEPFSGLDPASVEQMKRILQDFKAQGRTILFSTHQMASAEELCDQVGMIFQGRLVLDASLAQIQRTRAGDTVRLRTDKSLGFLLSLPGVLSGETISGIQILKLNVDPQRFLKTLLGRGKVRHFELGRATLNDIFLKMAAAAGKPRVSA